MKIPADAHSRIVIFGPAPDVSVPGSFVQGQLYGEGLGPSVEAGVAAVWRDVLRQLDARAARNEYAFGVAGLPQIIALSISAGVLIVTKGSGSDTIAVANSYLQVQRSPQDASSFADRFIGLTGATAASWTP